MLILGSCAPASVTPSVATPAPTPPVPTPPAPTTPVPTPPAPTPPAPTPTQPVITPPSPAQATGSAPFKVSNLSVDNGLQPEPGEIVPVTFNVTNTGGQQGTYTAVCTVNGVQAGTKDVTLAAGASQYVNIDITAGPYGMYTITVGDQTLTMRIVPPMGV